MSADYLADVPPPRTVSLRVLCSRQPSGVAGSSRRSAQCGTQENCTRGGLRGVEVQVSGSGRMVGLGGHGQAWHARLVGFVSRPGEAKQRVVITMKGRPKGVFVLTPLQPGVLKRDSGTLTYTHATG